MLRSAAPVLTLLRRAGLVAALGAGLAGLAAPADAQGDHVARLRLRGVIDQVNAAYVEEGLRAAAERGAAAAIVEINSPGGELSSMDRIIGAILNSQVPVITYVAPEGARAGSAATFITLAGDVAAMAPTTNIGAASVISGTGEDLPDTLERKVTNDAVSKIRALAEDHGRNADWAEEAVREAASINVAEAIAMQPPVVDILASDTTALLAAVDRGVRSDGYEYRFEGEPLPALSALPIEEIEMNLGQQVIHLLSDPNVSFILFTIGFYGILAELFHPNYFSGILGAIAIIVAFIGSNSLPLNFGGLLLILLGVGLFVLELTVTSHGLLTIGGIIAFVLGAFALWTGVGEPGEWSIQVTVHPALIGVVVAVSLAYVYFVLRVLLQMRRAGAIQGPITALVGVPGTAQTLIAPTGIAYAGGEAWSARSRSSQIAPGTPLRVVGVEGLELIVEPAPEGAPGQTEESNA